MHRKLAVVDGSIAFVGGINIVEAYCSVQHPMVKNRFVIEVGDTQALKAGENVVVWPSGRIMRDGVERLYAR